MTNPTDNETRRHPPQATATEAGEDNAIHDGDELVYAWAQFKGTREYKERLDGDQWPAFLRGWEADPKVTFENKDGKWWKYINGAPSRTLTDQEAALVIWGQTATAPNDAAGGEAERLVAKSYLEGFDTAKESAPQVAENYADVDDKHGRIAAAIRSMTAGDDAVRFVARERIFSELAASPRPEADSVDWKDRYYALKEKFTKLERMYTDAIVDRQAAREALATAVRERDTIAAEFNKFVPFLYVHGQLKVEIVQGEPAAPPPKQDEVHHITEAELRNTTGPSVTGVYP